MNANETKEYQKALQALKDAGAQIYNSISDAEKAGVPLASYGRVWYPSNGEEFTVPESPAVKFYRRGAKSNGVMVFVKSSLSGWGFIPVEWTADMPDLKEERDQLFEGAANDKTTERGNGLDRARVLAKIGKFTVEEIVLHGPTWVTDEDNNRKRIPDALDKPDRAIKTYYRIIPKK